MNKFYFKDDDYYFLDLNKTFFSYLLYCRESDNLNMKDSLNDINICKNGYKKFLFKIINDNFDDIWSFHKEGLNFELGQPFKETFRRL